MHETLTARRTIAGSLLAASLALSACTARPIAESAPPSPEPSITTVAPTPEPTPSPVPVIETKKVQRPLDKRCYEAGKIACISLQKTPGIKGTLYAMENGKVQFKVPVRSGTKNHSDGSPGVYTPRCETRIHFKQPVVYSHLLMNTVGLIPMYDAMSIGCTDKIHDKAYHGGVFIHGSLEFDSLRYGATGNDGKAYGSHGCVNVHNANGDSQEVYDFFDVGDRVVIYDPTTEHPAYKTVQVTTN